MIKFFHTADFHIGVENYGKINPKTGIHSRIEDFKNNLEECINAAISEKIDFFLFCGDAYKTAFPTPTQQKIFTQALLKLYQAKIPVVLVVGNHDHPLSFGKSNSLEIFSYLPLDGFYIFSKPSVLKLETKNGIIQIVGIPWPTRNNIITSSEFHLKSSNEITQYISQVVGRIIENLAQNLDNKYPAILAGHLTVSNGIFSGSEKCAIFGNDPIFLPSQIALKNFEYIALGHLHKYQNLNPNGYPAIVYPGSIERVDFSERKESKGFCSVFIDNNFISNSSIEKKEKQNKKPCSYNFVKLNSRPMVQIEINLNSDKDQTEQILEEIKNHEIKNAIVKIIYHIPDGKQDKVDLQSIQVACQEAICVTNIVPIRKSAIREKRVNLNVSMGFKAILEKYFQSKGISSEKHKILMKKAEEIYENYSKNTNEYLQEQ